MVSDPALRLVRLVTTVSIVSRSRRPVAAPDTAKPEFEPAADEPPADPEVAPPAAELVVAEDTAEAPLCAELVVEAFLTRDTAAEPSTVVPLMSAVISASPVIAKTPSPVPAAVAEVIPASRVRVTNTVVPDRPTAFLPEVGIAPVKAKTPEESSAEMPRSPDSVTVACASITACDWVVSVTWFHEPTIEFLSAVPPAATRPIWLPEVADSTVTESAVIVALPMVAVAVVVASVTLTEPPTADALAPSFSLAGLRSAVERIFSLKDL